MASFNVGDRVNCSSYLSKNFIGPDRYIEITKPFSGFFSGIKNVCVRAKATATTLPGAKDKSAPVDRIEVCAAVTTDRGSIRLVPLKSLSLAEVKTTDERSVQDDRKRDDDEA